MKVLMCNSFYYLRGGSERCFFDLTALLESHGHEVIPFSMQDPHNRPSAYSRYFTSNIDFPSRLGPEGNWKSKLAVAERTIYSREARDKITQLIADTKPDIAHVHGIAHETSPSILPAIQRAGIPVVQTLHDYKLLCPNTSFISHGQICERCKTHKYYQVVFNRCKRDSLAASLLAGVETTLHRAFKLYESNVDLFITPSEFLRQKLEEYGIENRVVRIPNFIDLQRIKPTDKKENHFIYYGRLSSVKGVHTLLAAMREVPRSCLFIAGTGDEEAALRQYAVDNHLQNVRFLGHLTSEELFPLVSTALFSIVPSEWYENYSMSVLESLAARTPVIGASIGGIPEQVRDGYNGLLFEPGNVHELAQKINYLLDRPELLTKMGRGGREQVENENNPDRHFRLTMDVYEQLLTGG